MERSRSKTCLPGTLLGILLLLTAPFGKAATPQDTLVMANAIDDIITLDPAEIFEFSGAEYAANTYDRLLGYDMNNVATLYGVAAESWTLSADGKTYTFRLRPGITFASGNPLTAEDAAFSLQRVVQLGKGPAFILTQFGFTPDNVKDKIRAVDPLTLVIETDQAYAPTLVLSCLTATVSSVVDKKTVLAHAQKGDLGHAWLRTHYAGSGPFQLRQWKPNEVLVLDRHEHYWGGPPAMRRVITRHIIEPTTQRLLLEKGDIDIARKLGPAQLQGLRNHPDIRLHQSEKGELYYFSLNQKNPLLAQPKVRQAFKYLVDYQGIADTLMQGKATVHQAFLPKGLLGALLDTPFALDLDKAKALLAQAGLAKGFSVTMDTRNSAEIMEMAQAIQATLALAGIQLQIIPADNKQTLTKYRARRHDIYIGRWGPDYQDSHSNAKAFASNSDNADAAAVKTLAWRNAWEIPEMTRKTQAAMMERDAGKRAQRYQELQREHQQTSPFVIMFQEVEVIAKRDNVQGFVIGPAFDDYRYAGVTKE
jgi:peptide/nickel transport system substrate-binding protein